MKHTYQQGFALMASILAAHCFLTQRLSAQRDVATVAAPAAMVDPFPATYADPAVPLLQLPANFRARRTTANISAQAGKPFEVLNVKGAGCVRHMWFVFGSIDVLALDGTGKVVALKERFRPWAFWSTGMPVSAVVELPVGTIERTKTSIGDNIALPRVPLKR